ncbi:poly(A) RNA polymerase gld-2 homolog A-like isoform X2 [Schistocerca nitens]|uniref:poly(A) RNA polymerase gld-2 homolog A-like isoform X2 n=1 Tax=Schistocerca nitens TaxID=7011 RepID=UPI0021183689|nr:poly(A) RNA polymerase gld-2 homolog A-like isoform X2 [Schistocerca nitens]
MYHAMFPPHMIAHIIGQQQQQHQQQLSYSSDNRGGRYCYNISPFEQIELLRGLVALDMPPVRNNRGYGRGSHSPLMPPPNTLNYHAPTTINVKNCWNKNFSRQPRCATRQLSSPPRSIAADSDSGFSSRSPTPITQQGENTEDSADNSNNNTSVARDSNKGIKRLHDVHGGGCSSGQPQQTFYQQQKHQHHPHHYHLHSHHQHQQHQPPYYRSGNNGSYQNKRHYNNSGSSNSNHQRQQYTQALPLRHPMQQQQQQQQQQHHQQQQQQQQQQLQQSQRQSRRRFFLPFHSGGCGPPVFTAPDHFLAHAHLMQVAASPPPPRLTNGSQWDKLSQDIWDKFIENQQTEETYKKKMLLWKHLYIFIKEFPRYGLFLVGSTMSGFGSDKSDVDMCLIVRHTEIDQRNEAVRHLEQMLHYLRCCDFVERPELIQAKVPILKFRDTQCDFEVDLNCNNAVGIRNTHLLYCYSQMDWRVRPLVLIVKLWAHAHNINDAKNMTISSYSLVLMVIHFLQCGVAPSVLPCLHEIYQGKFSPHSDIHRINIHEELRPFHSDNVQTLGELFVEFLRYYVEFDFSQYAISVRVAGKIPIEECRHVRSYKNDPHQWKYLCIEEPFDLTNTARSVYDRDVFEKVKQVFQDSYEKLKKTRDIVSIF